MKKSLSNTSLKKILETANERDLFIVGHMYIENTIDRILEKKFNLTITPDLVKNTLKSDEIFTDVL